MSQIRLIARIQVDDGRSDELGTLAEQCVQRVRAEDPGTLEYDWFFREDVSECVVLELYEDSASLLSHMDNLGDLLEELHELGEMSVELYGEPSAELRQALSGSDLAVYDFHTGL